MFGEGLPTSLKATGTMRQARLPTQAILSRLTVKPTIITFRLLVPGEFLSACQT